jgi:hypothetical protein
MNYERSEPWPEGSTTCRNCGWLRSQHYVLEPGGPHVCPLVSREQQDRERGK